MWSVWLVLPLLAIAAFCIEDWWLRRK